jgi:threonine/homoserine/homoserine lactone efflux protein
LHIAFAAAGLSALLATSATAFAVVRLVGAAYLVWRGITAIRQAGQAPAGPQRLEPARLAVVFRQGALVNALNPKVALFFRAFLPQFIEPAAADAPLAMAALGLVFNLTGLGCNLLVAWSAAGLARRIRAGGRLTAWLKRAVGTVFVALGLKLARGSRTG